MQHTTEQFASIPAAPGRIPGLDGLRAVSIILVMMSHFDIAPLPGGYGVWVFFVISGFLITRLSFLEMEKFGAFSVSNFYLRRLFRLYPVVITYVAVVCCAYLWLNWSIDPLEPLSVLFYFVNYLYSMRQLWGIEPAMQMPMSMFWSLAVEEHFYLVFPWLFIAARGRPMGIIFIALLAIGLAASLRVGALLLVPDWVQGHVLNMQTQFRMDAIAYGICLAALCQIPQMHRHIRACGSMWGLTLTLGLVLAAIALPSSAKPFAFHVLFGPGIAMGIAAVVFSGAPNTVGRLLSLTPVEWIGRLSYSLYVWHIVGHMLAHAVLPGQWWFSLVLSVALASASYYLVEQPFLRLKPSRENRHRIEPEVKVLRG